MPIQQVQGHQSCGAVVARRSYKIRQTLMASLGDADAVGSIPTRTIFSFFVLLFFFLWSKNSYSSDG